ncbi:hypothetical protein, partial [Escherichia coli]|uniref:hypothetical protein n=1 Tax=Escherichia coli TaxID=562 RepID=UPI003EDF8BE1
GHSNHINGAVKVTQKLLKKKKSIISVSYNISDMGSTPASSTNHDWTVQGQHQQKQEVSSISRTPTRR